MKPKSLFLSLIFLTSGTVLMAKNFVFTGADINETQLAGFILKVKKLNVGSDSPDIIENLLGNPSLKTRQAGVEDWKYDFLLHNDEDLQNQQKIEAALRERSDRRANMSLDQIEEESRKNDEKYEKLEKIKMKLEMQPPTQVTCLVKIDNSGKLSSVKIEKMMQDSTDILYQMGNGDSSPAVSSSAELGLLPSLPSAPSTPRAGQTYLNTTDSHFYGWNGKEWKQLDK